MEKLKKCCFKYLLLGHTRIKTHCVAITLYHQSLVIMLGGCGKNDVGQFAELIRNASEEFTTASRSVDEIHVGITHLLKMEKLQCCFKWGYRGSPGRIAAAVLSLMGILINQTKPPAE